MSDDKLPCADCRLYGCPDDGPDRAYNRARRHCGCHGAYRQPESTHRPALELSFPRPVLGELPSDSLLLSTLASAVAASARDMEFGEPTDDEASFERGLKAAFDAPTLRERRYIPESRADVQRALTACAGADNPQPGELVRLRGEVENLNDIITEQKDRATEAERQRDDALLLLRQLITQHPLYSTPANLAAFERLKKDGLL